MLLVGRQRQRTCDGVSRRAFLQVGASSVLGLSLADLLRAGDRRPRLRARRSRSSCCGCGAGRASSTRSTRSRTPRSSTAGRSAPSRRGSPASASANSSRKLAGVTDKLAVIRTLTTQSNDHGVAGTIGLTGSAAGGDGPRRQAAARLAAAGDRARSSRRAARRLARRSCRRSSSSAASCTRGRRRSSARAAARSARLYDPFRLEYDPADGHEGAGAAAARRT